jgi:predicted nucleic-acid-binding protein
MTYSSSPVDFADALVGRINTAAGCEHTVTFDRDLKRVGDFRVL